MEAPTRKPGARATSNLPVVITHDFTETYGGAERVTQELAACFPNAQVVSLLGRPAVAARMGLDGRFRAVLPARQRLFERYRQFAPFFPALARSARLPDADVLLSSSYGFAHHFRAPHGATHVCYCHSPLRFAWTMTDSYRSVWARGKLSGVAFDGLASAFRWQDRRSSSWVDQYLTQSKYTADQVRRFYGRDAQIVGAPVDCERFRPSASRPEGFYLLCSRLVEPYKRAGMVVDAFRRLPERLVVAGEGPALSTLRAAAPPNVEFLGHLPDDDLVEVMQRCRAVLFPSQDDFGLAPVEAMACGRPVLAYAGGGALTTVAPGVTGEFFDNQSVDSVVAAVRAFEAERYDPLAIRHHAVQWDRTAFRQRVVAAVERAVAAQ